MTSVRPRTRTAAMVAAAAALTFGAAAPAHAASGNLLKNPGFEKSLTSNVWKGEDCCVTTSDPHGGTWIAWMGGNGTDHTDTIKQTVSLPKGSVATVSFWLKVTSEEPTGSTDDSFKVRVTNAAGKTRTVEKLSSADASGTPSVPGRLRQVHRRRQPLRRQDRQAVVRGTRGPGRPHRLRAGRHRTQGQLAPQDRATTSTTRSAGRSSAVRCSRMTFRLLLALTAVLVGASACGGSVLNSYEADSTPVGTPTTAPSATSTLSAQHPHRSKGTTGQPAPSPSLTVPSLSIPAQPSGPVLGGDVSWPQCPKGMGIPQKRSRACRCRIAVGEVRASSGSPTGPGFTPNPCLAEPGRMGAGAAASWPRRTP